MYDLYLGSPAEIRADIRKYLLAVKRMLPRWANSLPDSEFQTVQDLIESRLPHKNPVFVETGIGATTILLLHYAMERDGRLISWDMNGSKASFLRTVAVETLEGLHRKSIAAHWTFVHSSSTSPYTGMPIIGELADRVTLSHHDSDHTWETISGEIGALLPLFEEGGIVCVDDANQVYQTTYEPIINMTRRKLGLGPIAAIPGNTGRPHIERIAELVKREFAVVEDLSVGFEGKLANDLYYSWYSVDRQQMDRVGMERMKELKARFAAYRLSKRVAGASRPSLKS